MILQKHCKSFRNRYLIYLCAVDYLHVEFTCYSGVYGKAALRNVGRKQITLIDCGSFRWGTLFVQQLTLVHIDQFCLFRTLPIIYNYTPTISTGLFRMHNTCLNFSREIYRIDHFLVSTGPTASYEYLSSKERSAYFAAQ